VDSEEISTAGTIISVLALLISTFAWRSTRRSALANERVSHVETIRLRGEMNPEWHVESCPSEDQALPLVIRAKLVGPVRLAVPYNVKAKIFLSTGSAERGALSHKYILSTRYGRAGAPQWLAQFRPRTGRASVIRPEPEATSADPSTLYVSQLMQVGDELLISLPPLLGISSRRRLWAEIEAQVHPFEPWTITKQLADQ
jgi:hypothetical protein